MASNGADGGKKFDISNLSKCANEIIDAIKDSIKNLARLNVIVAGKTGSGKSTLINSVFRANLAETGIGMPVTQNMRKYTKEGVPLTIYDTVGFELSKEIRDASQQEIAETIKKCELSGDDNQRIHCLWYCINAAGGRVEQGEIDWLREISNVCKFSHVPVIIVLTQSYDKEKTKAINGVLQEEKLECLGIIPVLAQDFIFKFRGETHEQQSFGLEDLIEVMEKALPNELQDTLQNLQKVSLESKKNSAHKIVAFTVTAAGGIGAAPIPLSDAFLLVTAQLEMLRKITVIFGIDVDANTMKILLSATLGVGGATLFGRAAVTAILKCIPGAGSLVGGAIAAGTAMLITTALGEAYIKLMEKVWHGEVKFNSNIGDIMSDLFKDELKRRKNKGNDDPDTLPVS